LQYALLAIGRSRRVIATDDADRSADIRRSQPAIAGRVQIGVIAASQELGNQRAQIRTATALRIPQDIGKCPVEQNILLVRFCVAHCYTPISGSRRAANRTASCLRTVESIVRWCTAILLAAPDAVHQLQEPASGLRTKRRHAGKFHAFNSLTWKTGLDAGGL
jgi:hypothetical protein